jgi:hypothetical protein
VYAVLIYVSELFLDVTSTKCNFFLKILKTAYTILNSFLLFFFQFSPFKKKSVTNKDKLLNFYLVKTLLQFTKRLCVMRTQIIDSKKNKLMLIIGV